MKHLSGITFLVFIVVMAARPSLAGLMKLPMDADRCMIGYALTGRVVDGCRPPTLETRITRSLPAKSDGYFIHFDLDSNVLREEAEAHLQRLSSLLTGPLAHLCIKLIGHTDTTGTDVYNMALSERRARSVQLFLAGPGSIDPERLVTEGRGEHMPLPGMRGSDPENRRVEILAKPSTTGSCR